jgi:hypothetical protein
LIVWRATPPIVLWIIAAIVYVVVTGAFFTPIALGECLPRGALTTAACDVAKHRDFWIYVTTFGIGPCASAFLALKRSSKAGPPILLAWSLAPSLLVVAANALLGR